MTSPHVIVIGGGVAGIAASVALRTHGASVTLLDAHATLGGRARSDELGGVIIDTGVQLIPASYARTIALVTRGVFEDETPRGAQGFTRDGPLQRAPGRDRFVRGGASYPLQFGSLRSVLTFSGLTIRDKAALAIELLPLVARHRAALDADGAHLPPALDAESAHGYIAARVSDDAAYVVAEMPVNATYAMRGDELSLAFLLVIARYAADSHVLAPRNGWSQALEGAVRGVTCTLGTRVAAIGVDEGSFAVRAADGRAWLGEAVVIATDATSARTLLAPLAPHSDALCAWLATVELRPTFTLALVIDGQLESDAFGTFRDAREATTVSACGVHADRAPGVALAWPTPAFAESAHHHSAAELAAAMMPEIELLVPGVKGRVRQARVYRHIAGTAVPGPGFAADRARGRALAEALPYAVAVAGDYLATPTVEGAVASGRRAALQLAARLGLATSPLDFRASDTSII